MPRLEGDEHLRLFRLKLPALLGLHAGVLAMSATAAYADVMLGFEAAGRAPYPLTARGLRASYALEPDDDVEATAIEARESVLLAEFRMREFGLRRRLLVNEHAYYSYGVAVRDVDLTYDVIRADGSSEHVAEQDRAFAVTGCIGIAFTVAPHVVVGSDLLGVSVPLGWSKHQDTFPADAAAFEDDPHNAYLQGAFGISYHALRTYVGVTF